MIRIIALLLLTCIGALAQGGSYCTMSTWEPRNINTKAGLVASYDPGNTNTLVHNGAATAGTGISAMSNRVAQTATLVQGTAASQPIISRKDNAGNFLPQSEDFSTTWALTRINAFGATDTGAAGAGSFANTSRTTDPLGGNAADFVQEDGTASNFHCVYLPGSSTRLVPAGPVSFSVCAKAAGRTWMAIFSVPPGGGVRAWFDLQNGAVGSVTAVSGATSTFGSITSLGNNWYLCRMGYIGTGGLASTEIYPTTTNSVINYNGDNTSGLYVWGASATAGSWTPVTGTDAAHGYVATVAVPIYPGLQGRSTLYFNNAAYALKGTFTLNQPTEVYVLNMPWAWTLNDTLFDGNTLGSGQLYQSATNPNIRASAGTATAEFVPPTNTVWRVNNVVFDGANSRMSTNDGPFTVADAGTNNMGGFTLGAAGTATGTYWTGLISRQLICNKTNAAAEANYLRWGLRKGTEAPF